MSVAQALTRQQKSFGLAFAIEDLSDIRRWAEAHQFTMLVVLDHVVNGLEFEEMVVLSVADQRERRVFLWRTFGTVFAQVARAKPRGFTTVPQALNFLSPPPPTARKTLLARWRDAWRADKPVAAGAPVVSLSGFAARRSVS
jgi:hypothetical protein